MEDEERNRQFYYATTMASNMLQILHFHKLGSTTEITAELAKISHHGFTQKLLGKLFSPDLDLDGY